MTKENIDRLVRMSRVYKRVGRDSLARLMDEQLDKERDRLLEAGLEDIVTASREAPETP